MTVLSKTRQGSRGFGGGGSGGGRSGGAMSSAPCRKTTQPGIRQRAGGAGSSPRLHLTQKRGRASSRRDTAGDGRRFSSATQSMDTKRGATSAAAHRAASNNSRGGGGVYTRAGSKTAPATGTGGRKRAAKADSTDVAKTLRVLKSDLAAALERTMGKVETECGEIVTKALNGSAASVSGREEDREMAEAALREMDTMQAEINTQCTGMLKTVESNNSSLAAMVDRCNAALDSIQQGESRKLKSALDRATGLKS